MPIYKNSATDFQNFDFKFFANIFLNFKFGLSLLSSSSVVRYLGWQSSLVYCFPCCYIYHQKISIKTFHVAPLFLSPNVSCILYFVFVLGVRDLGLS